MGQNPAISVIGLVCLSDKLLHRPMSQLINYDGTLVNKLQSYSKIAGFCSCLIQSKHVLCEDMHPAQDKPIETPDRARSETGRTKEEGLPISVRLKGRGLSSCLAAAKEISCTKAFHLRLGYLGVRIIYHHAPCTLRIFSV
jgi:hypothetical protein